MRLTKGQLKRIIREEYSKLKRRGLIRETKYSWMSGNKNGPRPFSDEEWMAMPSAEKSAYSEWRFSEDKPEGWNKGQDAMYSDLSFEMAEYIQDLLDDGEMLSEDEIYQELSEVFNNADEDDVADAMAQLGY
jgi:hypothetical protein